MNKKQVLFHLNRRLAALTEPVPDHVKMAAASTDYAVRQRAVAAQQAAIEKNKSEIEALTTAIGYIRWSVIPEGDELPQAEVAA